MSSSISNIVQRIAEWAAAGVELIGLAVIAVISLYSLVYAIYRLMRRDRENLYRRTRHRLAHGILLGLEFLVAADIIHTVAVDLSFSSVGVLAIVVAIRTFLSFSLEVELSGKWPWQQGREDRQSA